MTETNQFKNREIAEKLTFYMEEVAREEAARTGFDMQKEPHALFRMLMTVFATDSLRQEAIRRFKLSQLET